MSNENHVFASHNKQSTSLLGILGADKLALNAVLQHEVRCCTQAHTTDYYFFLFLKLFCFFFFRLTKLIKRSQHAVKLCARRHTGLTQHHQHSLCANRIFESIKIFVSSIRILLSISPINDAVPTKNCSKSSSCGAAARLLLPALLPLLLWLTRGLLRCC